MPFSHESEEEEDFPNLPPTQPADPTTKPKEPGCLDADKNPKENPKSLDEMPGDNDELTVGEPEPQYYKLPSKLDDLDSRQTALKKWSSIIDGVVEKLLADKKAAGKTTHFFNAAREADTPTETLSIEWLAFPKNLEARQNKWALADERNNQDEYCEWEVVREGNELKSVTFTTELPEYYGFLASINEDGNQLLQLYNSLNEDESVTAEDIFDDVSKYNGTNRFNSRQGKGSAVPGAIAHMITANNALHDLAELVIDSTVLYKDDSGNYITNGRDLIGKMDNSPQSQKRNSDPTVTANINARVRANKRVAIINPIGPYIKSIENAKIKIPGVKVDNWWTFHREGLDGNRVRAKLTIPKKYVGKLKDEGGNKIVYGSHIAQYIWIAVDVALADPPSPSKAAEAPQTILTYIEGRHIKPMPLPVSFVNEQLRRDPFGKYLVTTPSPALTLNDLIESLEDHTWAFYAAEEGIGYRFKTPRENVRVRVVIICVPGYPMRPTGGQQGGKTADSEKLTENAFRRPTFAVVAVAPKSDPNNIHSKKAFLQVASFNSDDGIYRFYDRDRLGRVAGAGQWLYFGSSIDAFAPDTQGLGPFCGHPNGGLVMKEIAEPWPHWHTEDNELLLPDNHPMMKDPIFRNERTQTWHFDKADRLAIMVLAGTQAWFSTRRYLDFGPIRNPKPVAERVHQWMAHVLMSTSVSMACSKSKDTEIVIPSGFFFDSAGLSVVMDDISSLEDQIQPCSRANYEQAREDLGLATRTEITRESSDIATDGEGSGPWKVLTPCPEDKEGIQQIIKTGLLPKRTVLALLMVDFWNPIFSYRRARLMRYMPSTLVYFPTGSSDDDRYQFSKDLEESIATGIRSFELDPRTSPEAEFLNYLSQPNLEQYVKEKLGEYVKNINTKLSSKDGVLGFMRLAEMKRRMFRPPPSTGRPLHPLAEFNLSLPFASKMPDSAMPWKMMPDASVVQSTSDNDVWHPRNTQAHFSSAGCPFSASF